MQNSNAICGLIKLQCMCLNTHRLCLGVFLQTGGFPQDYGNIPPFCTLSYCVDYLICALGLGLGLDARCGTYLWILVGGGGCFVIQL